MSRIELLAPAGDLEKLKFAIHYGADAVYIGGEIFGMRVNAKNFSVEDMKEGIAFAHDRGKKVYLTLNIIPHNRDIQTFYDYVNTIKDLGFDAYIVADPGTFTALKEMLPNAEIHISTQANTTNYMSANFWHSQGAKRIVLARELSLSEIGELKEKSSPDLDIEAFVHGAMCMSYSGRCLISSYLNNRSANQGACSQPCRWNYTLMEKTREGEYFPVVEDDNGTYFFNSRDMCTIDILDDIIKSGVNSLKIEGRSKTIFYVASVVRVYRKALDEYLKDPENYQYDPQWFEELLKVSYRDYCHGFYLGNPNEEGQNYASATYIRNYDFIGVVLEYDENTGLAKIEQRGKFEVGDEIEIMSPDYGVQYLTVEKMMDEEGNEIESCPRPKMVFYIPVKENVKPMDMLRKPGKNRQKMEVENGCSGCECI